MIYICIPALNEARTVGVLLWKLRRVMEGFPRDFEVLVLDDASDDDTAEVLAPYARILPLTVLRSRATAGYAAATERLLREAARRSVYPKRDIVLVMQADFTEEPEAIPALVKRIEGGAELVIGAAPHPPGAPRSERWGRLGLGWLVPRGVPAAALSGFRAFRASILNRALAERGDRPLLTRPGWAANVELHLALAAHSRRTEEVEVLFRPDRRQRPTRFRAWDTARDLWNLSRSVRRAPGAVAGRT